MVKCSQTKSRVPSWPSAPLTPTATAPEVSRQCWNEPVVTNARYFAKRGCPHTVQSVLAHVSVQKNGEFAVCKKKSPNQGSNLGPYPGKRIHISLIKARCEGYVITATLSGRSMNEPAANHLYSSWPLKPKLRSTIWIESSYQHIDFSSGHHSLVTSTV